MSKFNRDLQREILSLAIDTYPAQIGHRHSTIPDKYVLIKSAETDFLLVNIYYLHEHKLIHFDENGYRRLKMPEFYFVKATATGIDFMQQDGGLSAILNITTIKFHRDAVIVLEDLIALSNLNDTDKEKAKSVLGELSTDALKTVVQTATTAGLAMLIK
jgi:hypothetical protein